MMEVCTEGEAVAVTVCKTVTGLRLVVDACIEEVRRADVEEVEVVDNGDELLVELGSCAEGEKDTKIVLNCIDVVKEIVVGENPMELWLLTVCTSLVVVGAALLDAPRVPSGSLSRAK